MKKLIGTVAVAALLASAAFAEMNFGAYLNSSSAVVASDGKDIVAGVNNPWGGWRQSRFSFNWTGDEEKVGIILGVSADDGSIGTFTPNYMWAKPWDWLRVSLGAFSDNDTGLRSDLTYGSWGWLRPGNAVSWGEGITFSDVAGAGLRLQLYPVDGLQLAVLVPYESTFKAADDIYNKMQIAAGYTIGDIGTIKLGWWGKSEAGAAATAGKWKDKDGNDVTPAVTDFPSYKTALDAGYTYTAGKPATAASVKNEFDIAFDLTAIDGMFLTVGAKLTITDDSDNNDYLVALGWRYNFTDTFALFLDGSADFFGKSDRDPNAGAGVGINVGFTDSLNLDAEVRWLHKGKNGATASKDGISFLVGLNYSVCSNGLIGLGFQGHYKTGGLAGLSAAANEDFVWAVPLKLQVAF